MEHRGGLHTFSTQASVPLHVPHDATRTLPQLSSRVTSSQVAATRAQNAASVSGTHSDPLSRRKFGLGVVHETWPTSRQTQYTVAQMLQRFIGNELRREAIRNRTEKLCSGCRASAGLPCDALRSGRRVRQCAARFTISDPARRRAPGPSAQPPYTCEPTRRARGRACAATA